MPAAQTFTRLVRLAAISLGLTLIFPVDVVGAATNGSIAFARLTGDEVDIYGVAPTGGVETRIVRDGDFPAWNHDGTRIAFVRMTRKTGRDIFVMDIGGHKATQITDNPGDDVAPDWSSDSSRIVWESNDDIWVVDVADPTTAHPVVTEGSNNSPTWTPDGRILYSTDRDGDGTLNIHVVNANGTLDLQLTGETLDKADETEPHSSGTHIVYARKAWFQPDKDIYRMNSVGLFEERLIATLDFNDDHPRWSPDGTKIAFECDLNKDFDTDICTMNANGGGATTVTGLAQDVRPDWGTASA